MPYPTIGQYFDDFAIGQSFQTHGRTLTEADLVGFCGFIGDYEPAHADEVGPPSRERKPRPRRP